MLRVRIENFQSIADQTLEIEGFTVLTGKSNIGKSAALRAIRSLLRNASGTDFVRHSDTCPKVLKGSKTCKCFTRVTFEIPGPHTVVWEKGEGGVNRYTVDGVLYDKAERGYPPFLAPLRLDPIRVGSEEVLVQVSDQWNPLFLFGRPASEIAEVIGDVGDLPKVQEAIKQAEKDRRDHANVLKVRRVDLEEADKSLSELSYVPDLVSDFQSLESLAASVANLQAKVTTLRSFLSSYTRVQGEVSRLDSLLASFPDSLSFSLVLDKAKSFRDVSIFRQQKVTLDKSLSFSLSALAASKLGPVPDPTPYETLRSWVVTKKTLENFPEVPPPLPPLPDPLPWLRVHDFRTRLKPLVASYKANLAETASLNEELGSITQELSDIPLCPTCGQPHSEEAP